MKRLLATFGFLWLIAGAARSPAAEIRVAVAANFADGLAALAPLFTEQSGHSVTPIVGSTGRLFAQIQQGAPFDVFLAADSRRPLTLVDEELALRPRVYAEGRLVFWSALGGLAAEDDADLIRALEDPRLQHIALANPDLAPYGRAAVQTLGSMGLDSELGGRRVQGASVGQVWQFAVTGHAQGAFVALSQVQDEPTERYLIVPTRRHQPIAQMAVLLAGARDEQAAAAFLEFLAGEEARIIIQRYGYQVPESGP